MRLTLRTMLAYLDDVLDPADAQAIDKKIQESEFASGLVHRVRDSMRRLRLGAPKLSGRGMGLDPNTVAEYLDNTLAVERITDFEKVCLESDAHLAEVASCHQILTLVLGEPAEINTATRERMYRVASGDIPTPVAGGFDTHGFDAPHESPVPPPKSSFVSAIPKVEVDSSGTANQRPDYLRSPSRIRRRTMVLTLLLLTVLGSAALISGRWQDSTGLVAEMSPSREAPKRTVGNRIDLDHETTGQPDVPELPLPEPDPISSHRGNEHDSHDGPSVAFENEWPPAALPERGDHAPRQPRNIGDVYSERNVDAEITDSPVPELSEAPPLPIPADLVSQSEPTPAQPVAAPAAVLRDQPASNPPEKRRPTLAPTNQIGGHFTSAGEMLLRRDNRSGSWHRVARQAKLRGGDTLLALPACRPEISLDSGIRIRLLGGTVVRLKEADEQGMPLMVLEFGRVLISVAAGGDDRFGLQTGGRRGIVTLGDADSILAVAVRRFHRRGEDPESATVHISTRLMAASGQVGWQKDFDGEMSVINANQLVTITDEGPLEIQNLRQRPKWIDSDDLTDLDRQASATLKTLLADDRPVAQVLEARAEDARHEVRSLAVRSLGYLGQFEPLVSVLSDAGQRSSWAAHFDTLQVALAQSPESAASVRAAFAKRRSEHPLTLYRMLWGYSPQHLEDGAASELVDYLSHPSMDFRVLSFENLRRITGFTHYYKPELAPARQRPALSRWREKSNHGAIVYKRPPTAVVAEKSARRTTLRRSTPGNGP